MDLDWDLDSRKMRVDLDWDLDSRQRVDLDWDLDSRCPDLHITDPNPERENHMDKNIFIFCLTIQ